MKETKIIENTKQIIDLLESTKKLMKQDYIIKYIDFSDGYQIVRNSYLLDNLIHELENGLKIFNLQKSCNHTNKTGLIFVGNDSHYKYYHNKCKNCGFILEIEQI
jgi:hypothetical protein